MVTPAPDGRRRASPSIERTRKSARKTAATSTPTPAARPGSTCNSLAPRTTPAANPAARTSRLRSARLTCHRPTLLPDPSVPSAIDINSTAAMNASRTYDKCDVR